MSTEISKFDKFKKTLNSINYYIYTLCEIKEEIRKPFYIGKGKGDRCLQHLKDKSDSDKTKKIKELLLDDKFGIDILRHGIKTDQTAKLIEATCIDLLGIGELVNSVRGSGTEMGRLSIEEIHNLHSGEIVTVSEEHSGLAFLLNHTYKSGMTGIELFEATRGIWRNIPRDESIKYAYATYAGLVKEVYEVHGWVKAGTQQYFSRTFNSDDISERWEFIGRIANNDIRNQYLGKVIKKERSYGNPFIKVG